MAGSFDEVKLSFHPENPQSIQIAYKNPLTVIKYSMLIIWSKCQANVLLKQTRHDCG